MNLNNTDSDIIITGTAQADNIENYGSKVKVDGEAGNDNIINGSYNSNGSTWNKVTINGGAGDDSISNAGKYVLINGGDGNDSLNNWSGNLDDSSHTTINGDAGEDYIGNGSHHILIDGGTGNDVVSNFGNDVTIKGGKDDDFIRNTDGKNVIFTYRKGDGTDYIAGFNETSTLRIIGESITYSTQQSDSHIIITVGEGSITLIDAANLSTVHIETKESEIERGIYIENHDDNKILVGNAGDDSIDNHGSNVTITGGGGNDYIRNDAEKILFVYNDNDGNNTIEGFNDTSTLQIGDGKGTYSTQTDGDDWLVEFGNSVVLLKGAASLSAVNIDGVNPLLLVGTDAADTLGNFTAGVTIQALGGNDSITNHGANISISGGTGSDTIQNFGVNVVINGGQDNDSIQNNGEQSTIDGGAGSDFIKNFGVNALVSGGQDNDSIHNNGQYDTLNGGAGSDSIENFGLHAQINGEDGNDLIYNGGFYGTIDGGQGNDSIQNHGNYALILGAENSDTVLNYGTNSIVDGGADNDSVYNRGNCSTVLGGTGDDTIENFGESATVDGGSGDDSIQTFGSYVSINGGDGNDTITNENQNDITIDGGAGDDVIEFYGVQGDYIVRGGKGADTVYLRSAFNNIQYTFEYIYEYAPGDGDDVVTTNAIISLIDGATVDETTIDGNDVILKIGEGSIRIKDGKDAMEVPASTADNLLSDEILQNSFEYTYKHTLGEDLDLSNKNVIGNLINSANVDKITTEKNDVILKIGEGSLKIQNYLKDIDLPTVNLDDLHTAFSNNQYSFEYTYKHTAGIDIDAFNKNAMSNLIGNTTINKITSTGNDVTLNLGVGSLKIQNYVNALTFPTITPKDYNYYLGYDEITNDTAGQNINVLSQVRRKSKVQNTANNSTLVGGKGNNRFINTGENVAIVAQQGNNYIENHSGNCSVTTGDGADMIMLPTADNKGSSVKAGGGPDYIYNNGPNSAVDCGDGPDYYYGCPTSGNSTVKGGSGPDTLESEGNSKLDGGPDNDVLANGDNKDVGEKIKDQRDKAKQDAESLLEKLKDVFGDDLENSPASQDIIKNGADSEYLKKLPENERNAIAEIFKSKFWKAGKVTGEGINIINQICKDYDLEVAYLSNKLKNFPFLDDVLYKNYPNPKNMDKTEWLGIKNNLKNLDKYENIMKYAKLAKKVKYLGSIIEGTELVYAVYNAVNGKDNLENVVCEAVDFATSFLPPVVDMAAAQISRGIVHGVFTAYKHFTSADSGTKRLLTISYNANSVDYRALRNFYLNTSSDDVISFEALEEFYMNESNVGAVIGGDGNDVMLNNKRDNGWMNGGTGDDFIKNYNSSNVIVNGGTGNDIISNLNSPNTTINCDNNNDYVISNYSNNVSINTGEGNNTVSVYDSNNVTITTGNGENSISNIGKHVMIHTGTGNDDIFNVGAYVSINSGDGSDTIESVGDEVTIFADTGDNSIHAEGNNVVVKAGSGSNFIYTDEFYYGLIQTGDGSDEIINFGNSSTIDAGGGSNLLTNIGNSNEIFGGDNCDYIETFGDLNTVNTGADDDIVELGGNSNLIAMGAGNDVVLVYNSTNNTINAGKGDDLIIMDDTQILFVYAAGDGNDTICGFNETATLSIAGADYSTRTLNDDIIVSVGDGKIILSDAASLKAINISGNSVNCEWKLDGTTATYGDSITLTGIKSLDGVSLDNKIVTISNAALNQGTVTISDGYTLALGSDVAKVSTTAARWTGSGSTFTYTAAGSTAGYTLNGNKISYTSASGGDQFKITGLKNTSAVTVSGQKVTIGKDSLNQGTVTISDGYTLTLADDVAKVSTTVAKWTGSGSTFTYTAAGSTAGYTLNGNKISYTSASGGDKFSVTGLKNTSAVTVSSQKVTIGKNSLNGKAVTLTGDFTLALGKDVTTSAKKTSGAFSTVTKGTATYKTTATSDFYKVSGKKISYTAGTGGQSITIKNLNTAATLSTVKNGVTVSEQSNGTYKITFKNSGVLTTKAPTISVAKGLKYTVTVADSLEPVTKSAWNVSGTTATFRATTTAGYTVNSKNAVVYSAQKNGSALLELTGLAKNVKASSIAAPKGKVVTLKADVLGAKTSLKSNGGGYTLNLTGNMSGKKFTGTGKVDTLTVAANNANVDLGAGNDVVTVSGLKVTLSGGAGNDVLTGGKNVDLLYGGAGNDSILGNAGNDKIFGDAGNDTLRGGAGADTLTGGKGNDSLWGDAGKDTFLYSNGDGKDVIFGFENNDLLQITGTFSASYNKSKKEIAFKVGSTANAITLKDFTATSFHVNGDIYGISGNKFIKK